MRPTRKNPESTRRSDRYHPNYLGFKAPSKLRLAVSLVCGVLKKVCPN